MQFNNPDELEFAAFRFIAGEMNADEATDFERLLADEQSVRDAVCRAVAVTEQLTLANSKRVENTSKIAEPVHASQSRFGHVASAISWMAAGAIVASVALLLGGWVSVDRDSRLVDESEPRRFAPNDDPDAPVDPLMIDGLVWSQIDATTRWDDEIDWLRDFSRAEAPLPRFDLPAPQRRSLFEHNHLPGETE